MRAVAIALGLICLPAQADDAIWARDEAVCNARDPEDRIRCLQRATENRGTRMLEDQHRGKDPEFDRQLADCVQLPLDDFMACYMPAAQHREQRAIAAEYRRRDETKAQAASKARELAARHARTKPQRDVLASQYRDLLVRLFPNYNFIRMRVVHVSSGFALYGQHNFFSRYTFDIGPQASAVQQWVATHHEQLRAADVARVGVITEHGEATYFHVR